MYQYIWKICFIYIYSRLTCFFLNSRLLISQKYSAENTNLNSSQNNSKSWLARRTSTPASIRTEKMEKVERKGVIEFNEVDKTAKKNKKSKLCLIL